MRTVFKYALPYAGEVTIDIQVGARVLHVAEQNGLICLWAEVDELQPLERRTFLVRATGGTFSGDEGRYVGTVLMHDGMLVWHVYEPARKAAER